MSIVAINLQMAIDPEKLRDQILAVMTAKQSLTITIDCRDKLDSVVDILDDILELAVTTEEMRK